MFSFSSIFTKGTIGSKTAKTLQDCVREVQLIVDTCKLIRDDVIVLCHGGSIASPDDAGYILERVAGVDGFYGASSMERLPTEVAITAQVRVFAELRLPASHSEIVRQSN
jgi:predicted TIM-barrel enzyme